MYKQSIASEQDQRIWRRWDTDYKNVQFLYKGHVRLDNLKSCHEQRTFPNLPQRVMLQDFVYLDYLVFPALRHISDNKQSHHDWLFSLKCTEFCNIYNLSSHGQQKPCSKFCPWRTLASPLLLPTLFISQIPGTWSRRITHYTSCYPHPKPWHEESWGQNKVTQQMVTGLVIGGCLLVKCSNKGLWLCKSREEDVGQ